MLFMFVVVVVVVNERTPDGFGELGGLRASMSTRALWRAVSTVTGTALADQMSYLSKTMRLLVSVALYGPGSRRSGWW